ncbi:MAG TPA: TonB-dependent receptor [Bryobacteraceae bacterium]|nr:TonB-dependent receptor [Bryobacteraceae bacterium]
MKSWIALFVAAPLVYAQQAQHQTVVVTGAAEPTPLAEADRDVTVLALPAQQRPLFDSWFDLLQLDPTLDLQQRAPGGFLGDLSIRGATFGQTLVLLNGMRVNDAQTGHFNLDLPVPLDTVSSIEVMKGSGSALYGSDAIGGVVNVRTQPAEGPELRLFAGAGNYGTNEEHGIASFGTPRYSEELGFARDFSSGFAPDRDYRNLALSSLTMLRGASLLFAYSDRPYGADQFYGPYPSWERVKTWFASGHENFGDNTEASFAYRRHTDLFVLFRDAPQIYTNRHVLDSWQGDLRRHDNLPLHAVLSYGAEGLGEKIDSTNLGMRSRTRGSGYIFYDLRAVRRFSLSAGIREEVYGSGQVATSPSLSGAAWLSSRFKLRASASRAFRLPSFTDLYYSDPANIGNPNLKPESATSYEAGLDAYFRTNLHAAVTVFQRRDSDVIDYVRADQNSPWQATNFDKLHFTGVEASVVYEPRAGQRITGSFSALRGIDASGSVLLSKYTFNYPVRDAVVEWTGEIAGRVVARTRVGVVDRLARSPYAVWDASAGYSRGPVRPFLQLTNITSTVYEEIPAVPLPKRGVLGGLEIVWR